MASVIIKKKDFEEMRKELGKFDSEREKAILDSREIIQLSKQVIYAVQRDSLHEAGKKLDQLKAQLKKLPKDNADTNIVTAAKQEYVEAACFFSVIKDNVLPTKEQLGIDTYSYLLGLCDLTGELMRKGIFYATKSKYDKTEEIREIISELYNQFLYFNLRNGELRTKSDQIKWNLEKLDNVMYDITIRRSLSGSSLSASNEVKR